METDERTSKKKGELIEKGIRVVASGNIPITINYLISDKGGQGDVYHVSFRGRDYAMKWYCKDADDVIGGLQYDTISQICGEDKRPSEKFIWPLLLVTEENPCKGKRFGYLMELLPENYYEMQDYLRKDGDACAVRFKSYNAMLVAGMNIAYAMRKLHLKGLSYKDLNPNNLALNPENGDVCIIDNDNVSVSGGLCTVQGMKGYMAPEIPRSNYKVSPTIETDYYSLAVILYRLFFVDHPMEGKLWEKVVICTDKVEEFLYSIKPVFHFNPRNESNRPTEIYAPNAIRRWRVMPLEIRMLFIKMFTEGIDNPEKRFPEGVWIKTLAKCRDKLIRVNAEREQFVDFENVRSVPPRCLGIKIGEQKIALYPSKAIYQISVDGDYNQYGRKVAGITYSKQLDSFMIRNMTNETWRGWSPKTKQCSDILSGKEYPIFPGVLIEFQKKTHEKPHIVGEIFDARVKK